MTPLEMIREWRRGCADTAGESPACCIACTTGLVDTLEGALTPPSGDPHPVPGETWRSASGRRYRVAALHGTAVGTIVGFLDEETRAMSEVPLGAWHDLVGYTAPGVETVYGTQPDRMTNAAREHGMDLGDNPVAYEFYNPRNGHAVVDYTRWTHVGHLTERNGYIARPLQYAAPAAPAVPVSDPIPPEHAPTGQPAIEQHTHLEPAHLEPAHLWLANRTRSAREWLDGTWDCDCNGQHTHQDLSEGGHCD